MWCGRIDLRIAGGKTTNGELVLPRELGSAVVLHDLLRAGRQVRAAGSSSTALHPDVRRPDRLGDLRPARRAADQGQASSRPPTSRT